MKLQTVNNDLTRAKAINEELVTQCERLYLTNESNEKALKELGEINDELIKNIEMEKKAKDDVCMQYDVQF